MDREDAIDYLDGLLKDIQDAVENAYEVITEFGSESLISDSHKNWYQNILTELYNDHSFGVTSGCTLEDALNLLEDELEEEDDDDF